jgi:translation initiation factor 1
MAESDWKKRLGVVYSTDPNFKYTTVQDEVPETLAPEKQKLIVALDRRQRAGKQVTLIKGFVGSEGDLAALGKTLKVKCGVGGSVKDGEITLQGDHRDKALALLLELGYNAKRGN